MVEMAARRVPAVPVAAWLKALPPAERFAFYGGVKAQAAAAPLWGPEFSEDACRANAHATRATLWLGPDEYLLLDWGGDGAARGGGATEGGGVAARGEPMADGGPGGGDGLLVSPTFSALERTLSDIPHALVDISHRQFALEVSGAHAATILSGACPLDLDLAEFPVGMCTRTVLAKADIVLWRTQEQVFHLEVWRSFLGYVTGLLSEIALEFHPDR
jgi:sarcosine oxidase, subunit gamma